MAEPHSSVNDPRVLRAIAHPIRNQILSALHAAGPMRAADVATELGIAANLASFHLRQLAKYGLVEDDPTAARDKRDRVWKLVHESGLSIEGRVFDATPEGAAALKVYRRAAGAEGHRLVDYAANRQRNEEEHVSMSEVALKLTKAEARELTADLDRVVTAYAERTRGRDHQRRTYTYFALLAPSPPYSLAEGDTQVDDEVNDR